MSMNDLVQQIKYDKMVTDCCRYKTVEGVFIDTDTSKQLGRWKSREYARIS